MRTLSILLAALVSAQVACSRPHPAPANASLRAGGLAGSNLLLITIDTLRADRVGAYSGGRLTPVLDALATRGIRFTQAHAHVPLTLPAHTSILTGLVPATHGVHNNGSTGLAAGTPTLASLLHDAGYRTGAFVGAFVLDARFGLSHGFETYDDRVGSDTGPIDFAFAERTADRVTALAGDWILEQGSAEATGPRPWFAWVHLFDPHAPYRAPEQRRISPPASRRAVTVLEPLASPKPSGGIDVLNALGIALTQVGRFDRARVLFSRVLQQSPRSATTWSNLGLVELAARRPADAARAFERAVAADAGLAQAWQGLGAARAQSDPPAAIAAWKRALALEPRNYDLLLNLAVLEREQGSTAEPGPYMERFVREAPFSSYTRDIEIFRG